MQATHMTAADPCGCGGGCGGSCGGCAEALQRPRYFARQLVTPAELNLGTEYFMERHRRHNWLLHGWGVICGAQVCRVMTTDGTTAEPWKVMIRPGHLIDGHGNEVTIECDRIVDLRVPITSASCGDPPGEIRDPWCSDVWTERKPGTIWVAVCHCEQRGRPVRTQPTGCGCEDVTCEYSRWLDGYEVRLLDECPPSHRGPAPDPQEFLASLSGPIPECPTCPDDPCVVLAAVDVDEDGTVTRIDNCSCRRMILSSASFWWRCGGSGMRLGEVTISGRQPHTPGKTVTMVVKGASLSRDASFDLGPGVTATPQSVDAAGTTLRLKVAIDAGAAPGDRTLTITNADGSAASHPKALTVSPAP